MKKTKKKYVEKKEEPNNPISQTTHPSPNIIPGKETASSKNDTSQGESDIANFTEKNREINKAEVLPNSMLLAGKEKVSVRQPEIKDGEVKKKYAGKVQMVEVEKVKVDTNQKHGKFIEQEENYMHEYQTKSNYSKDQEDPDTYPTQQKNPKSFKKRYQPKPPSTDLHLQNPQQKITEIQSQSQQNSLQISSQTPTKRDKCNIKQIIPQSDFRKFIKLCTNIFDGLSEIQVCYSERRPLLFCQFYQNKEQKEKEKEKEREKKTQHLADIVNENRKINMPVDIELFWRTYDVLYKQVPEDFWDIAKFGMVRAEQENKTWSKSINIYKHKQLLKLYYVIDHKQLHFLLLHKQFHTIQYSTSYIQQKKLQFPYEFRSFEKFKRFLEGNVSKEEVEGDEEIDSEEEEKKREEEEEEELWEKRLREILGLRLDWLHGELKNMQQKVEDMEFGEKRKELDLQAMRFEEMIKQFQEKQLSIKKHIESKQITGLQYRLLAKSMIIAQKQLESKLPICLEKKEIFNLLKKQNLIVLQGQTGSGKSTQLPQILFQFYQISTKPDSLPILITQPRKIAARTLAHRVAEQLQQRVHGLVDYQCSSYKKLNPNAKIIFKLDRLVLDQLTDDPLLSKYCCLVVDEAHQRTISIDVILGRLKNLLELRKDFRIIITSASIDWVKFKKYYKTFPKKIPGRVQNVQMKYEPMNNFKDTREKIENFIKSKLFQRDLSKQLDEYYGHTLVFCPGIEDVEILVQKFRNLLDQRSFLVLGLHSKLTAEKQKEVFKDYGKVKIIFTTKIAETSITINGIKVVVNPGIDREIVYDNKTRISSLQLKLISKSQAWQRGGRAGRTGSGFCFHLYSKEQEKLMDQNKPPEILTTPPDSVVLRLKALNIPDIYNFPFLDAPNSQNMKMSLQALKFLGCLDFQQKMTEIGKLVLLFPIEPFLSRSIIQSLLYIEVFSNIDRSKLKMPQSQVQKLQKINLVNEVTKILCMLMNAEDLYVSSKQAINQKNANNDEFLSDYNLKDFQGEFELFSALYDSFESNYGDRKKLKKWSQKNKISIKSLSLAKQMHEQIIAITKGFQQKIKQIPSFKDELQKKMSVLSTLQSSKQVVNSCLLISLINYLSIFSQVPQLGYTMLSRKTPIILDQHCVNMKSKEEKVSKWAICFNVAVDQYNRVITKSCQPITIALIKKVTDSKIFTFLELENIDQFNPFYHVLDYKLPSIIFSKVVTDYKRRNFDTTLQFLCPYTFVINQKESSFTAYHLSTKPIEQLQKELNLYIKKFKWPFEKSFKYNYAIDFGVTFDKDFQLQSVNQNDVFYGFCLRIPCIIYNQVADELLQASYFDQKPRIEKEQWSEKIKMVGVIIGNSNLESFEKKIIEIRQRFPKEHDILYHKELIKLFKKQSYLEQKEITFEIKYPDASKTCLLIKLKKPMHPYEKFNKYWFVQWLKYANIKGIKSFQFKPTSVVLIKKQNIDDQVVIFYPHENQKVDLCELQQTLRNYYYFFQMIEVSVSGLCLLELSNEDWVSKLDEIVRQSVADQYYQNYEIEFVKRQYKSIDQTLQKKMIIQMKLTSRYSKICQNSPDWLVLHSFLKLKPENSLDNYIKDRIQEYATISSRFYKNQLLISIPTDIFDVLDVHFYQQCKNYLKSNQLNYKKSQDFNGTPTTEIYLRYEDIYQQLADRKEQITDSIKKIFTPKLIKVDQKYGILFKKNKGKENHRSFLDTFEEEQNFQVKLTYDEKSSTVKLYCKSTQFNRLQQKFLQKLSSTSLIIKNIEYQQLGLHKVLKILEKVHCENYVVDYDQRVIRVSEPIENLANLEHQLSITEFKSQKQCLICFQKFHQPYRLLNCHHSFCQPCLRNSINYSQNRNACPEKCQKKLNVYDIKNLVSEDEFKRICEIKLKSQIATSKQYFYCYSPDCQQIIRVPKLESKYRCPSCKSSYCLKCKQKDHWPQKCKSQQQQQEQLLKLGIRKCPKCGNGVTKISGCNHMSCRCGGHFCWKCGKDFSTAELCYSHLRTVHGGIHDDQALNRQINMFGGNQRMADFNQRIFAPWGYRRY